MGRLLAIGDIHGCRKALRALLQLVEPQEDDTIVFLGDYIDRGPDSRGVLDDLIAFQHDHPGTIFLRGNHDQLMLDTLAEWGVCPDWPRLREISPLFAARASASDAAIWLQNGGIQALEDYGLNPAGDPADGRRFPAEHLSFLTATQLWYQQDGYLFVHAGAEAGRPASEQDPYTLLWSRSSTVDDSGLLQVVGHTPTANGLPSFEPGRIKLDTGACFGGALTCLDVRTRDYWQARED